MMTRTVQSDLFGAPEVLDLRDEGRGDWSDSAMIENEFTWSKTWLNKATMGVAYGELYQRMDITPGLEWKGDQYHITTIYLAMPKNYWGLDKDEYELGPDMLDYAYGTRRFSDWGGGWNNHDVVWIPRFPSELDISPGRVELIHRIWGTDIRLPQWMVYDFRLQARRMGNKVITP